MIRFLGLGMMVAGCTALGLTMSRDLEKRIIQLREIRKMVSMLEGEIRCANATLAESFYHVSRRLSEPFSEFLVNMADHMEAYKGDTIKTIFSEHVDADLKVVALLPEDLEQLKMLGEQLGYLDIKMQMEAMKLYAEQVEDTYKQAMESFQKKSKMYRYLGLMGGLFLAIIFI